MFDRAAIDKYLKQFDQMGRATVKGIKAPHKPVLLLAVCNLIEKGIIANNHIELNKQLEQEFAEVWNTLVDNREQMQLDSVAETLFDKPTNKYPYKCNIANPFYYLKSEPFWSLEKSEQWTENKTWSVSSLRRCYKYAVMDETLYELMKDNVTCQIIRAHLVYMTAY